MQNEKRAIVDITLAEAHYPCQLRTHNDSEERVQGSRPLKRGENGCWLFRGMPPLSATQRKSRPEKRSVWLEGRVWRWVVHQPHSVRWCDVPGWLLEDEVGIASRKPDCQFRVLVVLVPAS